MANTKATNGTLFTVKDENGATVECEILFTFVSPDTGRNYIVYTDNKVNKAGELNVYANIFDPSGSSKDLLPIETEEEWNTIESILSKLESSDKRWKRCWLYYLLLWY